MNGLDSIALTKLDILTGLDSLKICTAYRAENVTHYDLPFGPSDLSPFEPIYEELPGWEVDLRGIRRWEGLPLQARAYIQRIEELCSVPVRLVSVGPERSQVVETDRSLVAG